MIFGAHGCAGQAPAISRDVRRHPYLGAYAATITRLWLGRTRTELVHFHSLFRLVLSTGCLLGLFA